MARIELIVVHDGEPGTELPHEVAELADRVLRTPGRVGGGRARNLGITVATGELIAMLDDDDEWLPGKLRVQLNLLKGVSDPEHTIVGSRQLYVNSRTGAVSRPSPKRLIAEGESVEHYLFRRRPPTGGRPNILSSTLLCPRELARSTPWDDSLARHQDWDWLVRLGRTAGTSFLQAPDPLVRIQLGSVQSISAEDDWHSSLEWANRALRSDPAVYADFLAGQPLRYALAAHSLSGVRTILTALRSANQIPSFGPLIIGIGGLLPRRAIDRVIVSTGGVR
jgi:glycosyltransferase involved in cell wall biosynthesis